MKTAIFLKMDEVKQIFKKFQLSNGANKSKANFRETIPLTNFCGARILKHSRSLFCSTPLQHVIFRRGVKR
jgi:hypothetical protein